MDTTANFFGKLLLLVLMYAVGILTGLYKAFVIHKGLEWFLPEYSQVLSIVQIWVVLAIYIIVTTKVEDDKDDKEEASVLMLKSFKRTAIKAAALSISLLGFYIVKSWS